MDSKAENQEFEKTIAGDDFDFDFDEDFESEVRSEYVVMDAMRFDREAGTASCNFEIDEDEDDAFRIPGSGRGGAANSKDAAGDAKEGKTGSS